MRTPARRRRPRPPARPPRRVARAVDAAPWLRSMKRSALRRTLSRCVRGAALAAPPPLLGRARHAPLPGHDALREGAGLRRSGHGDGLRLQPRRGDPRVRGRPRASIRAARWRSGERRSRSGRTTTCRSTPSAPSRRGRRSTARSRSRRRVAARARLHPALAKRYGRRPTTDDRKALDRAYANAMREVARAIPTTSTRAVCSPSR
jgi:hypothetical protein